MSTSDKLVVVRSRAACVASDPLYSCRCSRHSLPTTTRCRAGTVTGSSRRRMEQSNTSGDANKVRKTASAPAAATTTTTTIWTTRCCATCAARRSARDNKGGRATHRKACEKLKAAAEARGEAFVPRAAAVAERARRLSYTRWRTSTELCVPFEPLLLEINARMCRRRRRSGARASKGRDRV